MEYNQERKKRLVGIVNELSKIIVITSYSIHYTKLYEIEELLVQDSSMAEDVELLRRMLEN